MSELPKVTVTQIFPVSGRFTITPSTRRLLLNQEADKTQEIYSRIILQLGQKTTGIYLLDWFGRFRVPIGADVDGHIIGSTQHNQVLDKDGELIGIYERIKDLFVKQTNPEEIIVNSMLVGLLQPSR
jgi:hypothetical protein